MYCGRLAGRARRSRCSNPALMRASQATERYQSCLPAAATTRSCPTWLPNLSTAKRSVSLARSGNTGPLRALQTLAPANRLLAGLARLRAEPDDMHVGTQTANPAVDSAY